MLHNNNINLSRNNNSKTLQREKWMKMSIASNMLCNLKFPKQVSSTFRRSKFV